MQRLYNRIFLLGVLSIVFYFVMYLGWSLAEWSAVPAG